MSGGGELSGRTALVTGAGSGIGAAIARALAGNGAAVLLAHAPGDPREATAIASEIRAAGGRAATHPADVAVESEVADLLAACAERLGPAEILVANAGIATRTPTGAPAAALERLLAVNLLGAHHLFRAGVASMRAAGWGRLLATASTSGCLYGWPDHAGYCAAKAGLAGLVRAYAAEQGGCGITANAVAPGVVRTAQSLDPAESLGEEGLARVAGLVPAGRVGEPADVAGAFAFLAGDSAAYVNGQVLVVDGGLSVVEPT